MSDQPRIQQVADEFFWAEWDCRNQRLYIVYPKHKVCCQRIVQLVI